MEIPSETRKKTKQQAIDIISTGRIELERLGALLSQKNGWRLETNVKIVHEMVLADVILQEGSEVFLK